MGTSKNKKVYLLFDVTSEWSFLGAWSNFKKMHDEHASALGWPSYWILNRNMKTSGKELSVDGSEGRRFMVLIATVR